jgi:hypothetical protein
MHGRGRTIIQHFENSSVDRKVGWSALRRRRGRPGELPGCARDRRAPNRLVPEQIHQTVVNGLSWETLVVQKADGILLRHW